MGNVYALDSEKNLILYSTGNHICLRTSIGENLTRPVLLCSDFADSLSDIVYNNTVYYTYRNTSQDIIIRSITDLHDLYKISSHARLFSAAHCCNSKISDSFLFCQKSHRRQLLPKSLAAVSVR